MEKEVKMEETEKETISRKKLNVVFNYSGIELSQDNLLNRGLSFAITPLSLNLSQVLVDFSNFGGSFLPLRKTTMNIILQSS